MAYYKQISDFDATSSSRLEPALSSWIKSFAQHLGTWATTCADYYVAATRYDQLRCLSDAELARRGLNRATLARQVCKDCEENRRKHMVRID